MSDFAAAVCILSTIVAGDVGAFVVMVIQSL